MIAVVNGKGGVLKTSLTANVGGQLARRGFAVLLVDLDVSGNLKLDLGMRDPDLDDHGRGATFAFDLDGERTEVEAAEALIRTQPTWNGITAAAIARMRLQNRFKTGLDIARYTAALMRKDMAEYDQDATKYTQSLGWTV